MNATKTLKFSNQENGILARKAKQQLSGPISRDIGILSLRYPISSDTFSGMLALTQNAAIPPLGS